MKAEQPVLDLFEERPEAIVPACMHCSAHGEPIVVTGPGTAVPDMHAAVVWGWLEIKRHEREMHPEFAEASDG